MIGNRLQELDPDRALIRRHELRTGADTCSLARELAREFSAPVGILDTRRWAWDELAGAMVSSLPALDEELRDVASSALRLGRVALWHPQGGGPTWLAMAVPSGGDTDRVAFAGFTPWAERRMSAPGPSQPLPGNDHDSPPPEWGPVCPEPALRAWGQQVVNRLESKFETRIYPVDPAAVAAAENEQVVIGRLIRRMRISDSPTRFQALATNVVRTSLGMAAVAWVPTEPHEPVVTSGEIEGMRSSAFRAIVPSNSRDSALVVNHPEQDARGVTLPGAFRYVSVAAGGAGWLVGLNPSHKRPIGTADVERMQYVAALIATQSSNARSYAELKELLFGIIRALTAAVDAKDTYTCGHSERVARIAVRLAEELGMAPQKRSDLYLAGLLHDIGKIGVDDGVLKKPGPLTHEEYRVIQSHVETGVTILKDLKKLSHILPAVRHHHESVDGKGYPDHLSGDAIPLEARILAVADSFDAMSSDRLYRRRLSSRQIDEIFQKGRGVQWDPQVVDALFACRRDLENIRQKGLGESLIGAVNVTLGRG
jgi:putative nucleotidyltransferase with HDIG domain